MKQTIAVLAVLFCFGSLGLAQSKKTGAEPCDSDNNQYEIFWYPRTGQPTPMVISEQTLSNPANIRQDGDFPKLWEVAKKMLLELSYEGKRFAGMRVTSLVVTFDACSDRAKPNFRVEHREARGETAQPAKALSGQPEKPQDEESATEQQAQQEPSAVSESAETQETGKPSIGRRIAAKVIQLLPAAAGYGLYVLNPYATFATAPLSMFVAQPLAKKILRGGAANSEQAVASQSDKNKTKFKNDADFFMSLERVQP
ncbi:hypothetical protein D4R52_01105 [bacterium]|nr:MAG: hypothetical protein D4R52_01105 [bacterium]